YVPPPQGCLRSDERTQDRLNRSVEFGLDRYVLAEIGGVGALAGWRAHPQRPVPWRELGGNGAGRRDGSATPVVDGHVVEHPDVPELENVGDAYQLASGAYRHR